jgi:hypothetical protein
LRALPLVDALCDRSTTGLHEATREIVCASGTCRTFHALALTLCGGLATLASIRGLEEAELNNVLWPRKDPFSTSSIALPLRLRYWRLLANNLLTCLVRDALSGKRRGDKTSDAHQVLEVSHGGAMRLGGFQRLTFEMSCMTRLAGACQLDGRVRPHCLHVWLLWLRREQERTP